ncbi:MAG: DUF4412 domain-containing protein [Crocinitomicaceae bacterium]
MARLTAKSTILLSTLLCLFLSYGANAQIGQRIKERIKQNAERKIEDKVVNKAGEKTDQALDSLFKARKRPGRVISKKESSESGGNEGGNKSEGTAEGKSNSQANTPESSGFNFGGLMNAKYESSYTLDLEMKVEMKSQEKPKKKVETSYLDMYYGEGCYMIVFEDEKEKEASKALMDLKNNTSIVLNDQDMSGMAISMDFMTDKVNEAAGDYQDSAYVEGEDYTIQKTGRTKTIAGYTCEEYIIETDDIHMNTWYTDEIIVEMYQNLDEYPLFASMANMSTYGNQGAMQGTMMESHMVEKTGDKGTFDYLVKEVNQTPTTLNMSDYTFMKM